MKAARKNYLKEFIRRTSTQYAPTRKGIVWTPLHYPIYFHPGKARKHIQRVEQFMRLKHGMSLLDRIILKFQKMKEAEEPRA